MSGCRTYKGRATVGQSSYNDGKRRSYWVECWAAAEMPNGRVEPACVTLGNLEEGPPTRYIYCDQMKKINPSPSNYTILIELLDDNTVEMQVEEELVWRQWTKHIGLLLTIPHYPIPVEPSMGLPAEFATDIPAKNYDLHGVMAWGVVVVLAGIGKKAGMSNALCIAVVTSNDQLKIYPWNISTTPIITWDRNKLRRSGSIGDMVFMEAGRRCRFGPGLLWMLAETSVSVSLREGLHTFLFRGGKDMTGHFRRASEVSIASNRSSGGEASFDQGCSKTPESASGSFGRTVQRQASICSVNSNVSDSGLGAESLPSCLHSHPSVRSENRSPPLKQHSQMSVSSMEDPLEFDSERDSPVGGRSQTMPIRQPSQNGYYHGEESTPLDMDDEEGLRQFTAAPGHNRTFRSSPPEKHLAPQNSDYENMVPVKSLPTPPRNGLKTLPTPPRKGMTTLPCLLENGPHYPQSQDTLLNGMKTMSLYDQVVLDNPCSNYDNVKLQPTVENYENTAIKFKPQNGVN